MPSLLQLIGQEGQMATDMNDASLRATGRRVEDNIYAKNQNRGALWNIAGRGVSAGIGTIKDSQAFDAAKAAGKDTSTMAGVGSDGTFQAGKDFASNLVNPYGKYDNLRRVLRGDTTSGTPATHAADGTPAPTQAPAMSQPGAINSLDHQNAPLTGLILSNVLGGN